MVIVNFIRDNEVGMFARAKRLAKKGSIGYADTKYNVDSSIVDIGDSETEVSDKSEWWLSFFFDPPWVVGREFVCSPLYFVESPYSPYLVVDWALVLINNLLCANLMG